MLNVAIIGFGKMGQIRSHAFDGFGNCNLSWVCDSRKIQGDFKFTSNPEDIFSDSSVDAVFICTPNYLTKDLVVMGLDAGKHVFAEKPPGISVAEVKEMMAAEARNPRLRLKFGFNHRYHESMLEAKRRVDSGEYGRILWMRGRYGKGVDKNFFKDWRSKKSTAGGGILMDQGIHMLDLLLMFARKFDEVKSFCSNLYWNLDIEDNVFALLRNREGIVASLHSTMTQWRHLFALEIFLERGYMVVNGVLSSTNSYTTTYGKEVLTIANNRSAAPQAGHSHEERFVYDEDGSWKDEIEEFVRCIKEDKPVEVGNTQDALKLMTLIEKIYEDGKNEVRCDDSSPYGKQAHPQKEYPLASWEAVDQVCH